MACSVTSLVSSHPFNLKRSYSFIESPADRRGSPFLLDCLVARLPRRPIDIDSLPKSNIFLPNLSSEFYRGNHPE